MIVTVNGRPRQLADPTSVAELVADLTATGARAHRGVAVAVAGEVVPRGSWDAHVLHDGDQVEILTAVQGG
jgi:sulfur carrier protein